jgi:hypothetical protein
MRIYDELAVDDDDESGYDIGSICCQPKSLINYIYPIINTVFPFLD